MENVLNDRAILRAYAEHKLGVEIKSFISLTDNWGENHQLTVTDKDNKEHTCSITFQSFWKFLSRNYKFIKK